MGKGWSGGAEEKQKWLIQRVEGTLLVFKPLEDKEWQCVSPPLLFFKKASYTCLMVPDISGSRKKTEVYLENFPRQENKLKYLISSLPSMLPLPMSKETATHAHSVLSFIRPEKPQHPSGAYCTLPSQAFLANFWRNWILCSVNMIHVLLYPSGRHIIIKALATHYSVDKKQRAGGHGFNVLISHNKLMWISSSLANIYFFREFVAGGFLH